MALAVYAEVRTWQKFVNCLKRELACTYSRISEDGRYGALTQAAGEKAMSCMAGQEGCSGYTAADVRRNGPEGVWQCALAVAGRIFERLNGALSAARTSSPVSSAKIAELQADVAVWRLIRDEFTQDRYWPVLTRAFNEYRETTRASTGSDPAEGRQPAGNSPPATTGVVVRDGKVRGTKGGLLGSILLIGGTTGGSWLAGEKG